MDGCSISGRFCNFPRVDDAFHLYSLLVRTDALLCRRYVGGACLQDQALATFRLVQDGLRTVRVLLLEGLIGGVPRSQGEKNICRTRGHRLSKDAMAMLKPRH